MSIDHHRRTVMAEAQARAAARQAPASPAPPRRKEPMLPLYRRAPLVPRYPAPRLPGEPGHLVAAAIAGAFVLALAVSIVGRPASGPASTVVWPTAAQGAPTAQAAPTVAPSPAPSA